MSYSSKHVVMNISLFNNTITNYIFNQKLATNTGADSTDGSGNTYFKFQQAKAVLYGGELSIDIHPAKSLHFENSASVVYGLKKDVIQKLHQTVINIFLLFHRYMEYQNSGTTLLRKPVILWMGS